MTLVRVLFYFLSFIVIASALYAASSKNLVRSIFVFFVTLFSLAGLYVLALADFVAVTQVVIYVGGILVLILFAFMLSGKETLNVLQKQEGKFLSMKKLPAILLAVLFFIVLINIVFKANADNLSWVRDAISLKNEITPKDIMIDNIGVNLMTRYLLPFEAISILLLVALVGAAHLSRKEGKA
ncbi:NADH-quinone oxidoreductase subunit J family protein [Mucilaginibacter lappiensis]|uniref:NADH-quinone oxidoreductase subunit J n=1 Tax=Mucilaginibacter lappiensis TaxID=354630 RepID=A0A841JD49_9SPHI|nr:NADH-quinone oxidoreductase subunit J [Mucilaginibacter lappiensis]MBB6128272.1 NADH-quinone oxidoreductase subunit J [Mucilaginibacter lappiensis]